MKKLLFGLLVTLTTLSAYGQKPAQEPSVLITRHTSTQKMVWSDLDEKWMFFDKDERRPETHVWLTYFNDNGTGYIKMYNISDGEFYEMNIYNYELGENKYGGRSLDIDAVQITDGQKITIIVNEYEDKTNKMVTIFLPSDGLAIFFDTNFN